MPGKNYFLQIEKSQIARFEGDLDLALWHSALKDYARRFKPDRYGFVRVPKGVISADYGIDKQKIRRLNKRLEQMNLIVVDSVARGGRMPLGFKLR